VLQGIQWGTYQRLIAERGDRNGPRLYYDCGTLEIMSPSTHHERIKEAATLLIQVLADELGVDVLAAGSTTFNREDLQKGFEPDSCFYFRGLEVIRNKRDFNLAEDPPPDLVVEIQVTNFPPDRLKLFAAVGVPELWLYAEDNFEVWELEGSGYVSRTESVFLPGLTVETILEFCTSRLLMTNAAWMKSVREWAARRSQ
jgi:Uma2 family endonuclease